MDKAVSSSDESTIYLSDGIFNGNGNNNITLTGKNLTIIGAGTDKTVVDLEGNQLFTTTNSYIQLNNLTVINGYSTNGGVIYGTTSSIVIDNSKFENNSAATSGGVIYANTGNEFKVNNSKFIDNYAHSNGGSLWSNVNTIIENSYFENSQIITSTNNNGGGAIYSRGVFYLKNNTFVNCSSANGLGNEIQTYTASYGYVTIQDINITDVNFNVSATITDDMGTPIHGGSYSIMIGDVNAGSIQSVNGILNATLTKVLENGQYPISVNLDSLVVNSGMANVNVIRNYTNYYVSPEGNDSNNGSREKPFKTINKAITEGFKNGIYVNVYLLEGTYSGNDNINIVTTSIPVGVLNIIGVENKSIIDSVGVATAFTFGSLNVNIYNVIFNNSFRRINTGMITGSELHEIVNCTFENMNTYASFINAPNADLINLKIINGKIGSNIITVANNNRALITVNSVNNLLFENIDGAGYFVIKSGIENSIFKDNIFQFEIKGRKNNDAPFIRFSGSNVTSKNNQFINNLVPTFIRLYDAVESYLSVNDTFINNSMNTFSLIEGWGTFINDTFINNTVISRGLIYNSANELSLKGCIFENNQFGDKLNVIRGSNTASFNFDNNLTFSDINSQLIRSELKAMFNSSYNLNIDGYLVNFYLNGSYVGNTSFKDNVAQLKVIVPSNGVYEISGSIENVNSNIINGTLILNATDAFDFDVYVSENGSDIEGNGTIDNPFATIEKAFEYGNLQNTFHIIIHTMGTLKGLGNVNLDLKPEIDLTIVGLDNTSIIDAENNKYIFNFDSQYDTVKVYIDNLTIINGNTNNFVPRSNQVSSMGIINFNGLYSEVNNCIFKYTTGYAVNIEKLNSHILLNNCLFEECIGVFLSYGRAEYIIINNTEIFNCTTVPSDHFGYAGIIFIVDFSDNYWDIGTHVFVNNLSCKNNYKNESFIRVEPGVFSIRGTNTTVINSNFMNQCNLSVLTTYVDDSRFSTSNLILNNDTFINNTVDASQYSYTWHNHSPFLKIYNSLFMNSGGFGFWEDFHPNYQAMSFYVENSIFYDMNSIIDFLGSPLDGSYGDNHNVTISNVLFLNNSYGVRFYRGNVSNSVFYNTNVIKDSGKPILNNNYWNTLTPNVQCDSWIVPVLTSNNASGNTQELTLNYMLFDGENYTQYDVSKVPILPENVTFTITDGTLSNPEDILTNDKAVSSDYIYNGVGNKTVTASLSNDIELALNVTFYKIPTYTSLSLSANNIYVGENLIVNVRVADEDSKAVNGTVNIYMNSELKGTVNLVNGSGSLTIFINGRNGPYEIFANFTGDSKYSDSNNNSLLTVNRNTIQITESDNGSKENVTFNIALNYPADGNITLNVNNKSYTAKTVNGKATISIPPLAEGNYTASASYNSVVNETITFEIKDKEVINNTEPVTNDTVTNNTIVNSTSIVSKDTVLYYRNGTRFEITLLDRENKALANQTVIFNINGRDSTRTTDANGKASIALNLNSGEYTVTTTFNGTKTLNPSNATNKVTILSTVNASDITKVYRNGTQFYALFLDKQGNPLKNHTEVEFNINGVFYKRYTNENGIARLNINLEQGTYILTSNNPESNELYSNTINVLSKITDNNNLTKYYRNASQYFVKIVDSTGKTAKAGENITFNINGVFYIRTTNDTGHAKLNINLQPGDYIITAEYQGCKISNAIKVLPVLSASDYTKKYGTPGAFTLHLLDSQGKSYKNQAVTFNINGVFYQRNTDDNGDARLNINLQAGEYIITSSYNGSNIANTVTVTN